MTYRKTWFDYVLWAVYAGLCVTLLAFTGYHLYAYYVGLPLAKLGAFLVFPVLVCAYLALRLSCQAIRKKYDFSVHGAVMLETLVVSTAFVFGLLMRIGRVLHTPKELVAGDFYERALIRAGQSAAPFAHGVSDLYVRCLSGVFAFLGNSLAAAVLFQVFLQIIAMALGYCVVKKAAGRLPACVSLLCLTFSGAFLKKITVIDPECLFLALYLAGLFLTVSFLKAVLRGQSAAVSVLLAVFTGGALGALIYLELWSATLLFFLAGLFTGKCQAPDGRRRCITAFFAAIVSCVAGFFSAVAVDAAISGAGFTGCLSGWGLLYAKRGLQGRLFGVIDGQYVFWTALFVMAAFLAFEFVRGEKEQDYTLWFFPCILSAILMLTDFGGTGSGSVALFLFSVTAGLGIRNCVGGGQAEKVRAKIEKINETAEEPEVLEKEKTRFIENPLPLPKKHVKREMDYDFEISESDMHYQIDIPEGDDFDF